MFTCGGATSGYCAMGSDMIAPTPSSIVMIAMTQATIGRSMKIRDSMGDQFPFAGARSEEHTSELQSLMRITDATSCLKKKRTLTGHVISKDTQPERQTQINNSK